MPQGTQRNINIPHSADDIFNATYPALGDNSGPWSQAYVKMIRFHKLKIIDITILLP